ncbi:hypothetical protein IWX63_000123 [Arthrobacter sp. CAN_A2]
MIGTAVFTRTGCLSLSVTADRVAPSALIPLWWSGAATHAAAGPRRNSSSMVTTIVGADPAAGPLGPTRTAVRQEPGSA